VQICYRQTNRSLFFPSFIFYKCHFFFFFVLIILCKYRFGRNGRRIYVKEKGAIASLKVFKIFILISFSGLNLLSFSRHLSFVFWVFFLCTVEKIFHNLAKLKKSLYITSITSKSCMITCTRLGINYLFKLQTIECCENNKSCSSRRQCMQVFLLCICYMHEWLVAWFFFFYCARLRNIFPTMKYANVERKLNCFWKISLRSPRLWIPTPPLCVLESIF